MHRLSQCICILILLLALPLLVGQIFSSDKNEKPSFAFPYVAGLISMFAVFEVVALPGVLLRWTLRRVTLIWCFAVLVLAVVGICRASYIRRISGRPTWRCEWPIVDHPAGLMAIEMILFQIIFVVLHTHIDDDDAWYVGNAVVSYFTDTIYQVDPYTGGSIGLQADYALASFPIFWAMIAKLVNMHPASLMRTIAPIFLIPASYFVSWLTAKVLFRDDKEDVWYFMLFISVFHTFANFSVRSVSTFLMFRIWQGKAVLCSLLVPMAIYAYMRCVLKGRARDWFLLLVTVIAGTMASSMGNILMPFLLFALAIVTLFTRRRMKEPVLAMLCLAPCAVQVYLYLHVLR